MTGSINCQSILFLQKQHDLPENKQINHQVKWCPRCAEHLGQAWFIGFLQKQKSRDSSMEPVMVIKQHWDFFLQLFCCGCCNYTTCFSYRVNYSRKFRPYCERPSSHDLQEIIFQVIDPLYLGSSLYMAKVHKVNE